VHDTALRRGGLCPFAASRTPSAPRPACTVAVRRLSGRPRRAARHQRQGRGNVPSGAASLIHQRGARRAGSKSRSCLCVSPSLSTSPPGVPQQANRCSRPAVSTSPSPSKSAGHSGGRNSPAPEFTPGGRREEGGEGFVCLVEADGEAVSAGMWLFLLLESFKRGISDPEVQKVVAAGFFAVAPAAAPPAGRPEGLGPSEGDCWDAEPCIWCISSPTCLGRDAQ